MYFLIVAVCLMASTMSQTILLSYDANSAKNIESSTGKFELESNYEERMKDVFEAIMNLPDPADNDIVTNPRILQIMAYKILGRAPKICETATQYQIGIMEPSSFDARCKFDMGRINKTRDTISGIIQSVRNHFKTPSMLSVVAADQIFRPFIKWPCERHAQPCNMTRPLSSTEDNYAVISERIYNAVFNAIPKKSSDSFPQHFRLSPEYDGYSEQLVLIAKKYLEEVVGEFNENFDESLYINRIEKIKNELTDLNIMNVDPGSWTRWLAIMARILLRSAQGYDYKLSRDEM